jgi:hypothetical protein
MAGKRLVEFKVGLSIIIYAVVMVAIRCLPTSNPSLALTSSVLIVFPFNAAVGIPMYHYLAEIFARML